MWSHRRWLLAWHISGKKAALWPYVPYDMVAHPFAPGVYIKRAPAAHDCNY
ncbi:hypothetical protein NC651_008281 [Populus alba x Populus x berolinensis]|nr:hypothetical protein NC651_008281 [Populus alba x Populus x berolinensis]